MRFTTKGTLTIALALVLLAGAALAQAPDFEPERPARGRPAEQARVIGGPDAFLAIEGTEVAVANVADGVELTITTADAAAVEVLQERVTQGVANLQRMIERFREQWAKAARPRAVQVPGLWGVIWGGQVDVAANKVENGAVVSITSKDQQVVKNLQDNMPRWIEEARERQKRTVEIRRRWRVQQEVNRLIAEGEMNVELVPTDDGLTVKFTSDDPQMAAKIKKLLPEYFEALKAQAAYRQLQPMVQQRVMRGPGGREERRVEIRFPRPGDAPPPPPPDNP